jgi:hypothetical protein
MRDLVLNPVMPLVKRDLLHFATKVELIRLDVANGIQLSMRILGAEDRHPEELLKSVFSMNGLQELEGLIKVEFPLQLPCNLIIDQLIINTLVQ